MQIDYPLPLGPFGRPRAKIDFITISIPESLMNWMANAGAFHKAISGRIELPKGRNKDWITLHDPVAADLQWLLDNHPQAKIQSIEVAIDFTLRDGSNNPEQLAELHGWLKTRLFPQRHSNMALVGKRKYYDARSGRVMLDTLNTKSGNETVYWTNPKAYEQVRLYIKSQDNRQSIDQHTVRLEATLFGGGCQNAGLYRVAELPQFADQMRRHLSKFLYVAAGIKPKLKRVRTNTPERAARATREALKEHSRVDMAWRQKGAAWAAKHGYATTPDVVTNRVIGNALKGLRDALIGLELTQKVAEHAGYEVLQKPVNQGTSGSQCPSRIEGQRLPPDPALSSSSSSAGRKEESAIPQHKVLAERPALHITPKESVCTPKN